MGMEVVGAEASPAQVKVSDGEVSLFQEKESKETAKEREDAAVFGSDTNGATNDLAPPKDAKDEWPEPKQTHAFFFVKVRSNEDPKIRAKLEQADKEFQKKIQARSKLIEAVRAKKVLFLVLTDPCGSKVFISDASNLSKWMCQLPRTLNVCINHGQWCIY
jgi:hypothetical protein